MSSLNNLHDLGKKLQKEFESYFLPNDVILPESFKNSVKELGGYKYEYKKYLVHIHSDELNGYIPNQWFIIASFFVDYYIELQKYKNLLIEVLKKCGLTKASDRISLMAMYSSEMKNIPKEKPYDIHKKETIEKVKKCITEIIDKYNFQSLEDKNYLIKFVSDYDWWYGGKTIDRGDFYVSPILALAKVVNASHSYIADICKSFAESRTVSDNLCNTYKSLLSASQVDLLKSNIEGPHQQIFYGAPGTGKSYATNEVVLKYPETIRTTFHPDSDYSTFVGAYKPTTVEQVRYGLNGSETVPLKYPDGSNKGCSIYESKIEYRFVKQAFLKAYIKAWKKMADGFCSPSNTKQNSISFSRDNAQYLIINVESKAVEYKKTETIKKTKVKSVWGKLWDTGTFKVPTGTQSGESVEQAICTFIHKLLSPNDNNNSFDEGWNLLINKLRKKGRQKTNAEKERKTKYYIISATDDADDIVLHTSVARSHKDTLKTYYNGEKKPDGVDIDITEILKGFKKQDFDDAWVEWKKSVELSNSNDTNNTITEFIKPQFLVIEEINRGNCAQIFGDLFQLLDRKSGYSEYPIDADEDIRKSLLSEDTDEDPSFGENGLQFTDDQKNAINAIYQKDGTPFRDVAGEIAKGKILVLPPNFYIWATMNTSDQSLFPIDSAFKRRWDWKYIPISEGKEKWSIVVKDKEYDWWIFLKKMNSIVGEATMSEDKKMGFYFCKADDKKHINAETFVSKVMFYLWNDVFKDNGLDWKNEKGEPIFKYKVKDNDDNEKEEDMVFSTFFKEDGTANEDQVERLMINMLINPIAKPQQPSAITQDANTESDVEAGIETEQATDTEPEA